MAMLDYGSIVKKNGKIIQEDLFMDMKKTVGFELEKAKRKSKVVKYNSDTNIYIETGEIKEDYINVKDNFFSYMGDEELLVCVYKGILTFISNGDVIKTVFDLQEPVDVPYKKHRMTFIINNTEIKIKRLYDNNRYLVRFWYKGDLYECIYGYGVDLNLNYWYNLTKKEKNFLNKWFYNN